MHILGSAFIVIGFLVALVFGVQMMVMAFQTSVRWGLGYLLVPFVALIFIFTHWEETKTPALRWLICIPCYALGFFLSR